MDHWSFLWFIAQAYQEQRAKVIFPRSSVISPNAPWSRARGKSTDSKEHLKGAIHAVWRGRLLEITDLWVPCILYWTLLLQPPCSIGRHPVQDGRLGVFLLASLCTRPDPSPPMSWSLTHLCGSESDRPLVLGVPREKKKRIPILGEGLVSWLSQFIS